MSEGLNVNPTYPDSTGCECLTPGYCQRHHCDKPDSMHRLCQTRPRFFDLWERGIGPGQAQTARQSPCGHRGEQIDESLCESCQGQVRIKIFACRLHNRCSLSKLLTTVAGCLSCCDYLAATEQMADASPDEQKVLLEPSPLNQELHNLT